jgi:hypothetical protein
MKRVGAAIAVCAVAVGLTIPAGAGAAPLPDNCTKEQGTVTCTTTEGPGKNQGGVGTTESVETQGNTKNKSPEEQQDLTDECTKKPAGAQGDPIGDCPA